MGRPRKNEQDRRVVQVNIRLTEEETNKVNGYATASGLSPANWIRYKVFTGKYPPVKMSPLDASVYRELRRIGVNLNQATHRLNLGEFPKDYRLLQLELFTLLNRILKLIIHDGQHDQG